MRKNRISVHCVFLVRGCTPRGVMAPLTLSVPFKKYFEDDGVVEQNPDFFNFIKIIIKQQMP